MGDDLPPLGLAAGRKAKAIAIGYYDGCVAQDDDSFVCGGTSNAPGFVPTVAGASLLSLSGAGGVLALYSDGVVQSLGAINASAVSLALS